MKNTTIFAFVLILVVIGGFFLMRNFGSTGGVIDNEDNENLGSGEVQQVTIGIKDYNYYPQTIRVKANQPVSITLDQSVVGCYRAFVIRDLGVQKNSRSPSDTINFTPTKKGTFKFACTMGMGTGTIIVE